MSDAKPLSAEEQRLRLILETQPNAVDHIDLRDTLALFTAERAAHEVTRQALARSEARRAVMCPECDGMLLTGLDLFTKGHPRRPVYTGGDDYEDVRRCLTCDGRGAVLADGAASEVSEVRASDCSPWQLREAIEDAATAARAWPLPLSERDLSVVAPICRRALGSCFCGAHGSEVMGVASEAPGIFAEARRQWEIDALMRAAMTPHCEKCDESESPREIACLACRGWHLPPECVEVDEDDEARASVALDSEPATMPASPGPCARCGTALPVLAIFMVCSDEAACAMRAAGLANLTPPAKCAACGGSGSVARGRSPLDLWPCPACTGTGAV